MIFNRLLVITLAWLTAFTPAHALVVNGELKNAQLEKRASDSTGTEAQVIWNTTEKKAKIHDGSAWTALGSGSGQGELNLLTNPSGATNTDGWTASGSGSPTVTRIASGGPLDPIIPTALRLDGGSAGAYIEGTFTVPDSLANTKLKFEWHQEPESGAVSGEWKAEVYKDSTELPLSTDSSGNSLIPNDTGKYTTTFDTRAAGTDYKVRFVRVTGSNHLDITSVIVGPGIQTQVPAGGPWQKYFDDTTASSFVNNFTAAGGTSGFYRQDRDTVDLVVRLRQSGNTGSSAIQLKLPSGLTPNLALLPAVILESYTAYEVASTGAKTPATIVWNGTANAFEIYISGGTDARTMANGANTDAYYVKVIGLPVNEWAGTVNIAQNDVEYVSNNSTWDSSNTSAFVYGSAGSAIGGALTANRTKRVRFKSPIQPTDHLIIEYSDDGIVWVPGATAVLSGNLVTNVTDAAGTTHSGAFLSNVTGSVTDVDVIFGRYQRMANDDSPVTDWSSGDFWRVRKATGGQAVGFGAATPTSSGLVNTQPQSLGGTKTFNDGIKVDDSSEQSTLNFYATDTVSSTFTSNGTSGGTSSAVTIRITRIGDWVSLFIPPYNAASGTGTPDAYTANTALPTWARPLTTAAYVFGGISRNSGGTSGETSRFVVLTSGILQQARNSQASAFTVSTSCGLHVGANITYYVGTGS